MRLVIESIKFIGFQSEKTEAFIKLSGSQTSIIFGRNGSGKTTFLKLINAILSKDESILSKEKVFRAEVVFVDEIDEKHTIIVGMSDDASRGQGIVSSKIYDWRQFDESPLSKTTSMSMGVDRGTTIQSTSIEASDIFRFLSLNNEVSLSKSMALTISEQLAGFLTRQSALKARSIRRGKTNELQLDRDHAFLNNINTSNIESLLLERYRVARSYASEQIQNALFDTLAVAIDSEAEKAAALNLPEDLGEQIVSGKERIIEALNEGPENKFKNRIIAMLSEMGADGGVAANPVNPIFGQLIWNMLKELKLEKQLLDSINIFIETFNYFLGEGKEIQISSEGISVSINGDSLGIDSLSSGERHLFTFLALVVVDARNRDFLIIDEPEISLNANWQRSLVKLLEDLAPDTQIILASHSPILAKGQPSSLVELKPVRMSEQHEPQ
ncbi:AAA family ATPase [Pseudomonas sp. RC3H12]|uniref:AAA family ATPase n=1 Tax=Pseudomonas sp. RC3H12 TaxID=2834406 RepID=UPI001BDF4FA9|nr:AAA family ATPase [Pseudomonas sp. RC3H12]QWA27817.1 AAA family ATPase [Pseudomonas sp. RC3H12]